MHTGDGIRILEDASIRALHDAVEAARYDWTVLSALSGDGPVGEFEASAASFLGARYAVGVSSGTAALLTALVACRAGAGTEVILPAYSWGQTLGAVLHCGATPVFVDIDPERLTANVEQVANAISERTSAIVAVHMYGHPADLWSLRDVADRSGVALVEDAAQAFGSTVGGRHVGTVGDVGCFSLGRGKPLTGGEGGLLVTNREDLFERAVEFSQHPVRQRRDLGDRFQFLTAELGLNFRMHPLAAVIARSELEGFPERLVRRQQAASELTRALADTPGIKPVQPFPDTTSTFWRFPLTWRSDDTPGAEGHRRRYLAELFKAGIPVGPDPVGVALHRRGQTAVVPAVCPESDRRCEQTGLVLASSVLDGAIGPADIVRGFEVAARVLSADG